MAYQVEQDLLLTRCMEAIVGDSYLSGQVAMRGGTVLHKVHLAPPGRYSEDIDLVAVGQAPPGHIARALWRVLEPIVGGPPSANFIEKVQLAVRNALQKSEIRRLRWDYATTAGSPPRASVKVEVNVTERQPVYQPVRLPLAPASGAIPALIVSFDVNEMLGTKLRALRQREKGRDLFDLAYAWKVCSAPGHAHPVSPSLVARAFAEYVRREGTTVTRADFEADLSGKLMRRSFRADLHDVLANADTYDIDEAADVVRTIYLAELD